MAVVVWLCATGRVLMIAVLFRRWRRWRCLFAIIVCFLQACGKHLRLRTSLFSKRQARVVDATDRTIRRDSVGQHEHGDKDHRGDTDELWRDDWIQPQPETRSSACGPWGFDLLRRQSAQGRLHDLLMQTGR